MWVGTLSGLGSACWFTGFAIADVALVRAVGQVEIVFTLLFSRFYLKETLKPGDVVAVKGSLGSKMKIVVDAIVAARSPHWFPSVTKQGVAAIFERETFRDPALVDVRRRAALAAQETVRQAEDVRGRTEGIGGTTVAWLAGVSRQALWGIAMSMIGVVHPARRARAAPSASVTSATAWASSSIQPARSSGNDGSMQV